MANQPKRYKKFVATAATATLVASAIAPVASASFKDVADNNDHKKNIEAIAELGYMGAGDNFRPSENVTRGQVAIILANWAQDVAGLEVPADYKDVQRFKDVPLTADDKLLQSAALVKEYGIFEGSNGNLNGASPISREHMALVLNKAYEAVTGTSLVELAGDTSDVTFADEASINKDYLHVVKALKKLGITAPASFNPKGSVTRGQFASFFVQTVNAEEPVDETELKVESVSAINAKQIEVKFNQPVDSTTARYLGNYYLQNSSDANYVALSTKDATATITLDSTKKVATITFTADINTGVSTVKGTPFNFQVKDVKSANGSTLDKYTTQLSVNDTVAPTVVSATASAKTTTTLVTLEFSEPVQTTGAIVYIDGKAATVQAGDKVNQLKVTASQNLTAGTTYPVTVLNVQDFGGNFLATNPTTVNVVVASDTEAPALSNVVVKTDRVIEATFTKAVDLNTFTNSIRLVDAAGNAYTGNAAIVASYPDASNKAVVNLTLPAGTSLTFNDSNVYSGTVYFSNNIADLSGNKLAATSKSVTITKDTVAPTISTTKFIAPGTVYTNGVAYPNGAVVVEFSEDVTYNAGTIQLIDKNGTIVSAATVGAPVVNVNKATELVVPLTANLSAGTYTVITPGAIVKDQAFATTSNVGATKTVTVTTTGDTNKPVVVTTLGTVVPASSLTSGTTLQVNFTDDLGLDLTTILNVNNYLLNGLPLPAGSYVTTNITGGTASAATAVTATINIPAGSIAKTSNTNVLNVVNVKDLNGNVATPVAYNTITLNDDIAPELTGVTIASNGTLVVSFSEDVTAAAPANLADFDFNINGINVNAAATGLGTTVVPGVGTDAGKYVITLNGYVDGGADATAATTSDNRVFIDVNNNSTYDAGVDILVKTGTTTAVGATTINANELLNLKVITIASPTVVKDTAGYALKGGKVITVK